MSIVRFRLVYALAAILLATPAARSQTPVDWNGSADTAWANPNNWVGGVAPADDLVTNIANFNSAFTIFPNAGVRSIAGLAIGTGRTAAFTISSGTTGGGLSIGGSGISFTSTGTAYTVTLGAATNNLFTVAAPQTWNVATAVFAITVSGTLAIDNLLTLTGPGTVRLSNPSTGGGGVTTNSGRLVINNGASLGTGTFTIQGGALDTGGTTLASLAGIVLDGNFTFQGTGAMSFGTNAVNLGAGAGPRTITVTTNTLTIPGAISDGSGATSLSKAGGGTLLLSGANNYSGGSAVTAGVLSFGSVSSIAGTGRNVSVGAAGVASLQGAADLAPLLDRITIASSGAAGLGANSAAPLDFTPFPSLALGTSIAGGVVYTGVVTPAAAGLRLGGGPSTLVFAGTLAAPAATLTFAGATTVPGTIDSTGPTTFAAGIAAVGVVANGGVASSLGSSSSASANLVFSAGTLFYSGILPATTDRGFTIAAAGTATIATPTSLTFTGNVPSTTTGGLTKNGTGALTLSGANAYTGTTLVNGGRLVFDYSAGNDPLASASPLRIDAGGATFRAAPTGPALAKTVNSVVMTGLSQGALSTLTLDANGNANGIQLTIPAFNASGTANITYGFLDLSSSPANSITATITGNVATNNGVVGYGTNRRAIYVLRDATGYGFLTTTATANGTFGRLTLTQTTPLDATAFTSSQNLSLTGAVTRGTSLDFNTLTVDTASGPASLTFTSGTLNPAASSARGILITGPNDATISGPTSITANSLFISHYGTGTFALGLGFASGNQTSLGGTGFVVHSGAISATATNLYIGGLLYRTTVTQNLVPATLTTLFTISSGAVFEIGADLNGATAGDFTNAVGTGAGQFRFVTDSGVSAAGANRVVNFGGASAQLTWGAGGFLVNGDAAAADGGYSFKLSSARSDATVEVQNPITFNARPRTVDVADGSAATDARLSGVLSGVGGSLVKGGAGTLELTGVDTYTGTTTVLAGTLALAATGSIANSSTITVAGGATFNVSAVTGGFSVANNQTLTGRGGVTGSATVPAGGTIRAGGTGTGNLTVTGTVTMTAGTLGIDLSGATIAAPTVTPSSVLAVTNLFNVTGSPFTIALTNDAVLSNGTPYSITVATSANGFQRNGSPVTGTAAYAYGTDYVVTSTNHSYANASLDVSGNSLILNVTPAAVPEPASLLGLAAAGMGIGGWIRRKSKRVETLVAEDQGK